MSTINRLKIRILGIGVFLGLLSCSNDMPVASRSYTIEFSEPWTQKVSRTYGELDNENLTKSKFQVWGWKDGGEVVFDGREICYKNGAWTYEPKVFWDTESTYDFVALAPTDVVTTATCSKSGISITNIPQVQESETGIDYLVSDYIQDINYKDASDGLQFTFHHILGKLQVWARCTFEDAAFSAQVDKVVIANMSLNFSDGQFKYDASYGASSCSDYDNEAWSCTNQISGTTTKYLVPPASPVEFNREKFELVGTPFFVAPTPQEESVSVRLNLLYKIELKDEGGSFSFNQADVSLPSLNSFHQGYVTNLYLNIRLSQSNVGLITASVDPKIIDYSQDSDVKVDEQGIPNY